MTSPARGGSPGLEAALARLDALPGGVQAEVRAVVGACLDVVGPALVRALEVARSHDALDELTADPAVADALELCGLLPTPPSPAPQPAGTGSGTVAVTLSPRRTCEVCGAPIAAAHAHAADLSDRRLLCVCGACRLGLSPSGRYRPLPEGARRIAGPGPAPQWWEALGVPVEVAFFVRSGATGDLGAFYPGTAGVVESDLPVGSVPPEVLPADLADDVEAVLVRAGAAFEAWRVPVDRCYELAGLLRHRRSDPGGAACAEFFASLEGAR